jgi:hypothetical protein
MTTSQISFVKLSQFLSSTGSKNPEDPSYGPFQYAYDTKLSFFGWLKDHPDHLGAFNSCMSGVRMGKVPWFKLFPVETELYRGLKQEEDAVLVVDVGGGGGHDLEQFKAEFPNIRGRLIVQDLPATIDQISQIYTGIEFVKYEFLTPKLVKGKLLPLRTENHEKASLIFRSHQAQELITSIVFSMTGLTRNVVPYSRIWLAR